LASLACCSRSAGLHDLGGKLFDLAKQLSKLFYDEPDEIVNEPLAVSFGFLQMAIYVSATDRQRCQKYVRCRRLFPFWF